MSKLAKHLQVGLHLLFGHKLLMVVDSLHFWTISFGDEVVLRFEGRVRQQLQLLRASEVQIPNEMFASKLQFNEREPGWRDFHL